MFRLDGKIGVSCQKLTGCRTDRVLLTPQTLGLPAPDLSSLSLTLQAFWFPLFWGVQEPVYRPRFWPAVIPSKAGSWSPDRSEPAERGHFWGRFPPPVQGHGHRCQLLEKAASPDATVQCVYVHRYQLWPQLNVKALNRRRIQLGLIDLSKEKKNPLECSFEIY